MWSRGQAHARTRSRLHIVTRKRRVLQRGLEIVVAAKRTQVHARAVHGDLDLMRVFEPAHRTKIGPEETRLDHVLAVERQRGVREHSADRPDGQSFDVLVL